MRQNLYLFSLAHVLAFTVECLLAFQTVTSSPVYCTPVYPSCQCMHVDSELELGWGAATCNDLVLFDGHRHIQRSLIRMILVPLLCAHFKLQQDYDKARYVRQSLYEFM